jgi:hypothetical protein
MNWPTEIQAAQPSRADVQVEAPGAEVALEALLPSVPDAQSRRLSAVGAIAGAQTETAALRLLLEEGVPALGIHRASIFELSGTEVAMLVSRGGPPPSLPAAAAQSLRSGSTVLTPEILATPILKDDGHTLALVLAPSPAATADSLAFLAALLAACRDAAIRAYRASSHRRSSRALALWREKGADLSIAERRVMGELEEAARTEVPLLLVGERFCGKRDAAVALHGLGARARGPFVDWREVGDGVEAVTRAMALAEGGTLYLGRVDQLDPDSRQWWTREIRDAHEGSRQVRLVASAPSGDNAAATLFVELLGGIVEIPPLRRRRSDVPLLVSQYLAFRSSDLGLASPAVSSAAMKAMRDHRWPGNFAELQACLEWASLACPPNAEIQLWDLPPGVRGGSAGRSTVLSDVVSAVERAAIIEALGRNANKKIHAAVALGISRPTLDKKIAEYKIRLKRSAV